MKTSRKTTIWIALGVIVAGVAIAVYYRPLRQLQCRWAVETILESDATNQQKLDKLAAHVAIGDNIGDVNARLGTHYSPSGLVTLDESTGLALVIDDDGSVTRIAYGVVGKPSDDWNWLHSPKQPLLVPLDERPPKFTERFGEMVLPGHAIDAVFQIKRAYLECWISVEADGEEIAKSDILRIDQTSFSDTDGEIENITVDILCTQLTHPDVRLTQSGLDHSFSYGLALLGEHGNSTIRAGPAEVTVNFGVMPTSTPSFRESIETSATGLPDQPTQPFTVYATSRTGQIVDSDNEKQLQQRKIRLRVMCRLVEGEG